MKRFFWFFIIIVSYSYCWLGSTPDEGDYRHLYPELCIAYRVINIISTSYSLGWLENLKYPKDRTKILVQLEELKTTSILEQWISDFKSLYKYMALEPNESNYLEQALKFGRRLKCDYLLITTSDVFLAEDALRDLISLNQVVVSGLIKDPFSLHSNGRGLVDSSHLTGDKLELLRVYYANSPLLININHKDASYLTFDEQNLRENIDAKAPIKVFAFSAYKMNIPIYLDNRAFYGYLIDSSKLSKVEFSQKLSSFVYQLWVNNNPILYSNSIQPWRPVKHTFGFDKIYIINLKRRPERRRIIEKGLTMLGVDYQIVEAIDGMELDESKMENIKFLPGYLDPFYKRPLKRGEIGCFLSHYHIWNDVVENGYSRVIVFEDDIKFSENATTILREFVEDTMKSQTDWDFVYLGRKKNDAKKQEFYVPGHRYLSTVSYSYWTLGYALSLSGAKKLVQSNPLQNLLALDEFLPIMYNDHPNEEWKSHFPVRDLKAFTVYPLVVHPHKYLNDPGYLSDTENSTLALSEEDYSSRNLNQLGVNIEHTKSEL